MGLDGNFYLLTSNQDGRGIPTSNDDRILKIVSISLKDEINGDSSLPPLKQIAQGIAPEEVICKEGLKLIIKNNSSSACVRLETGVSLEQRGWGVMPRG